MIRVYICPVIGAGIKGDMYRSKGATFGYQYAAFIPTAADGTPEPSFAWALTVLEAGDFTAIDADPDCDDLFGGDLPASIDTRPELRALLTTRTVADVPTARRNAIIAVLDKYGVDRTDFTGQTPLWRVFQRVLSTLFGTTIHELDPTFPFG